MTRTVRGKRWKHKCPKYSCPWCWPREGRISAKRRENRSLIQLEVKNW